MDEFLAALPKHVGLSISHNEHKLNYQPIEQYLDRADWITIPPGERQLIVENDEIWECHWYPNTPVGFVVVAAHSLQALIDWLGENTEADSRDRC
jgi:hypothetical protein